MLNSCYRFTCYLYRFISLGQYKFNNTNTIQNTISIFSESSLSSNPILHALRQCWLAMHFLAISWSASVLCHAIIIFSNKSLLLVIILSLQISFFRAAHIFFNGLLLDFLKSLNKINLLDKNHLSKIIWPPTVSIIN